MKRGMVSEGNYCLDFYYHMFGHHIGNLTIFTMHKGTTIFEKIGEPLFGLTNRWRHSRKTVTLENNDGVYSNKYIIRCIT